jgi:hypothetical protein
MVGVQVRGTMDKYPPYQSIFAKLSFGESQMLDKAFYEEEVKRLCQAFEQQVLSFTPHFCLFWYSFERRWFWHLSVIPSFKISFSTSFVCSHQLYSI